MEAASASAVCSGPALARNSGATSAPTGVILGTEAGSAAVGMVVASTSEAPSTPAGADSGANLAGAGAEEDFAGAGAGVDRVL